ncbi:class I SAM-dependent methyltransferase [Pelagibius sp.]|uniref:class I SAM-dependent methyltransferase n=1 Tax=Pelagibius sp. TaxID=1931238 RepID=UPI0026215D38|nr:class I SAM-dependent methyltransferase [Pelagibius sp.]
MTQNQALHQTPAPTDAHAVDLSGVPETMLWTLWNRACEMRRASRLIEDPMAADLVARIDYDFAGRFGRPSVFHPVRARYSDDLIRAYLRSVTEDPVVVALGEGLETQLLRVDDGRVRWVSVDLPEAMAVRRKLLPAHPRGALVEASALDPSWMDAVPRTAPPFITAAGLLMYFEEAEVAALLCRIAEAFPGAQIFFDAIPPVFSRKTLRGLKVTRRYTAPPMPWGISIDDLPAFIRRIPGLQVVSVQSYADPFPQRTRLYRTLSRIPALRRRFAASLAHLRCRE